MNIGLLHLQLDLIYDHLSLRARRTTDASIGLTKLLLLSDRQSPVDLRGPCVFSLVPLLVALLVAVQCALTFVTVALFVGLFHFLSVYYKAPRSDQVGKLLRRQSTSQQDASPMAPSSRIAVC